MTETGDSDRRPGSAEAGEWLERSILLVERFNLAVHDQVAPALGQLEAASRQIAELSRENGYLKARLEELERRLAEQAALPAGGAARPWWAFWRR